MTRECRNCEFWRPTSPDAASAPCRIDPPTAQTDQNVNQPKGSWPWTDAGEDCGKFSRGDMGVLDQVGALTAIGKRLEDLESHALTIDDNETSTLFRLAGFDARVARLEQKASDFYGHQTMTLSSLADVEKRLAKLEAQGQVIRVPQS